MAHARVRQIPTIRPGLKVRRIPDWEAAGLAGLFGGLCFMLLEMALMPFATATGDLWRAPWMVADIVFDGTLANPGNGMILATALFTHFTLSLIYGRVLGGLIFIRPRREAQWIGALFGLALYFVNFYGIGALIPRLYADRNWAWLVCHVAFGVITARAFVRLERVAYE